MSKQIAWEKIDEIKSEICSLSDEIWEFAETRFKENRSAEAICKKLEQEGFSVERGIGGLETAFKGTFGSGKPIIGFLGEYDALSGLNQKANVFVKTADNPGLPGHGCGHNLLGCGALAASIGVKNYLEKTGSKGTIIYFGCPGEEGGSGKAFMAREGLFANVDIALDWHPSVITRPVTGSSLANYQVSYKFYGKSAHAGAAPHLGRSALDAMELMNMGVQFLREHIIPEARIHYAITNTGGYSPNVVQAYAEVLYLIRAPRNSQVEEIYRRVNKIAEGAAHMTETHLEIDFIKGCSNLVGNRVLAELMWNNLNEVGAPDYTDEEIEIAKNINDTAKTSRYDGIESVAAHCDERDKKELLAYKEEEICRAIAPWNLESMMSYGSTDVGDVSWNCPTCHTYVTTWAAATPGHSWQIVAQGKSSYAYKGMIFAAKALAGAAIDLYERTELVEKAWIEMRQRLNGERYLCPIPEGCNPTP